MKRIKCIAAFCLLAVAGCGPSVNTPMTDKVTGQFHITRVGVFDDDLAYGKKRGVHIITDTKTGKEYLGISGIGVSEVGSHLAGKVTVKDER